MEPTATGPMKTTNTRASEQKASLLRKWYDQAWSADNWAASAGNLWRAAQVLFLAYESSTDENGEPVRPEDMELNVPATLLFGYATENAIKALLIKKRKLNDSNLPTY